MKAIREAVTENALTSGIIDHAQYVQAISVDGRAWVCVDAGVVVGFACGRVVQRDIYALFLRASHHGRGIGSHLLTLVEDWLFGQGLAEIRLTTEPGTRAERLYRRRGWIERGHIENGDLLFSLARSPRG